LITFTIIIHSSGNGISFVKFFICDCKSYSRQNLSELFATVRGVSSHNFDVETKTRARLVLIQTSINHRDTIVFTSVTSFLASRCSGATVISLRAITVARIVSCGVSWCPSSFLSRLDKISLYYISLGYVTNTRWHRWFIFAKVLHGKVKVKFYFVPFSVFYT